MSTTSEGAVRASWADPSRRVDERVAALLAEMTTEEKLAQLVGVWVGVGEEGEDVAPAQHEFFEPLPPWEVLTAHGLGQVTRIFGTAPVEPLEGARALAATQRGLQERTRLGIPAMAHEECLTGFTAWGATVFPTSLAWGAAFDPETVERMAHGIGRSMRSLGIHQALSPVLDVTRDYRWGRTEETIGEDPYLVGTVGAAYVRGLESAGIVSTLKHFAGYSASRAGRNHAPVGMGPREFADVLLVPFEMALREGGARSVMPSYAEVDGVAPHGDPALLTTLLRDQLGFTGVVVADYYAVSFLETAHHLAASRGDAAELALRAGVDVELPSIRNYGAPLAEKVRSGEVGIELVDRAVARVLRQKCELGLLDEGWDATPEVLQDGAAPVDLDPPHMRDIARLLAEESVVLLSNPSQVLPLAEPRRVAVVGPCADDVLATMGCYAFPTHVGVQHPGTPLGIEVQTVAGAIRAELSGAEVVHTPGCEVASTDRSGFAAATQAARDADVCVAVLGDRAGLFGRGTSGEGCDAEDLSLPGVQADLLDELLATGTPVVLVLLTGRPYALGDSAGRLAAAVQCFFPGEEGAGAIAGVLSGRVNPSGKLPVQVPRSAGIAPSTYLQPALGHHHGATNLDPTPLHPFGHGLSYTTWDYADLEVLGSEEVPVDGEVTVACTVRNSGDRSGTEVVQLYLHDPVASATRPVRALAGFARVPLGPGEAARVTFRLHADRTSFTGPGLRRVVEPGEIRLLVGASSEDIRLETSVRLVGETREVGADRVLSTPVIVTPA